MTNLHAQRPLEAPTVTVGRSFAHRLAHELQWPPPALESSPGLTAHAAFALSGPVDMLTPRVANRLVAIALTYLLLGIVVIGASSCWQAHS